MNYCFSSIYDHMKKSFYFSRCFLSDSYLSDWNGIFSYRSQSDHKEKNKFLLNDIYTTGNVPCISECEIMWLQLLINLFYHFIRIFTMCWDGIYLHCKYKYAACCLFFRNPSVQMQLLGFMFHISMSGCKRNNGGLLVRSEKKKTTKITVISIYSFCGVFL